MVLLVEDKAKDGLHGLDGDLLLLSPLHIEDTVLDAIGSDKRLVLGRHVFLHEGAGSLLARLLWLQVDRRVGVLT